MKETSKTRHEDKDKKLRLKIELGVLSVITLCLICCIGLYPNGIEVTTIKDSIRAFDNLSADDFDIKYTNRFGILLPISAHAQERVEITPAEITDSTREISIKLDKYSDKKLTSPIRISHIESNIDETKVYEGDMLDTSKLKIEAVYVDDFRLDITEDVKDTEIFTSEHCYSQHRDITANTKYGQVKIDPDMVYVESIIGNVEGIGEDTGVWYSGETPIINSLNIIYSNNETRTVDLDNINSDFKLSDNLVNIGELQPGENVYSVNYADKQLAFSITAKPAIKCIDVADKTVFMEGETLENIKNRVNKLVITYEDGSANTISFDEIEVLDENINLTSGNNAIKIKYLNREFELNVIARSKTKANIVASNSLDELASSNYSHVSDTIFTTVTKKKEGSGTYWLTHVVVNDVNQLKAGLSYDDFGGKREKPTVASKRLNWVVGGNASYFSYDTGEPVCASVFIRDSKLIKGTTTNGNEVCMLNNGTLYTPPKGIDAQTLLDTGVRDIWGTSDPLLIQDGQLQDLSKAKKVTYPRCAIGMVEPGEYYMITAGSGGYKGGLTFNQMQNIFNNLGCKYARSLDGGGSASLVFNGNLVNNPAADRERPVVDFIYFTK